MKIRTGFISNSSTTAFCIYGIHVSANELGIIKNSKNIYKIVNRLINKHSIKDLFVIEDQQYKDYLYIGKRWKSISNDETGKDFKLSVQNEILKMFPNYKGKFKTYKEVWI